MVRRIRSSSNPLEILFEVLFIYLSMNIWLEIKNQKAKSDLEILPEKVLEMYIEVI